MNQRIETVSARNFELVLPLIANYQEFYQRIPDEAANRRHFSQFLSGQHPLGIQFLALDSEGRALGFATLYFLPSSLAASTSCVLNDLFTVPEARKQGVGEALVRHCLEHAALRGYASLDWQTAPSNTVAQSLYDRLGARRVSWYHYSLATPCKSPPSA
jgi:ribosomal protein S18 acetylase RimI-like enzyme